MTETPERYEGMDGRHRGVLERFKAEDPESYEHLFGGVSPRHATVTLPNHLIVVEADGLAGLRERAEKAERALLETWNQPVEAYCSHIDHYVCIACEGRSGPADDEVEHAEDCIVPGIMERYAE